MNSDVNVQEAMAKLKLLQAQLLAGAGGAAGGDGFAAASATPAVSSGGPLGMLVNVTVLEAGREYPVFVQFGPEWCGRPRDLLRMLSNKGWNLKSYPVREESATDGFVAPRQPNYQGRR